jgi:hypothetical protein
MKYIGTYSNDADIATKAKVDAKQDKVLVDGILKGDGQGAISAAETQEVELVTLTKADVGLGNVANVLQYSEQNKPPYPVTSVNGQTGDVELTIPTAYSLPVASATTLGGVKPSTKTDAMTQDVGVDASGKLYTVPTEAPVQSVNGKIGAVSLTASDVGALPSITVSASDNGKFLRVVNGVWAAATVENANGVSF